MTLLTLNISDIKVEYYNAFFDLLLIPVLIVQINYSISQYVIKTGNRLFLSTVYASQSTQV